MKSIFIALCFMLTGIIVFSGCQPAQTDPINVPVTFTWTATGDDGTMGQASFYSLRFSTNQNDLTVNWESALEISGIQTPAPSGVVETFSTTISVETGVPYYFAIKAADEAMNWSPISNVVSVTFADVTAPAAIIDLSASKGE